MAWLMAAAAMFSARGAMAANNFACAKQGARAGGGYRSALRVRVD
jgi:hypothetical protein